MGRLCLAGVGACGGDVFDYIERFHNQQRRHSTLDFVSPVQFEPGLTG